MKGKWIHFTEGMIKGLEEAVRKGYAPNINEAVRDGVREYLIELGIWRKVGESQREL